MNDLESGNDGSSANRKNQAQSSQQKEAEESQRKSDCSDRDGGDHADGPMPMPMHPAAMASINEQELLPTMSDYYYDYGDDCESGESGESSQASSASTRERRVSFGIPTTVVDHDDRCRVGVSRRPTQATDGTCSSVEEEDFYENGHPPPCYAVACGSLLDDHNVHVHDNDLYYDEEGSSLCPSKVDGISFSSGTITIGREDHQDQGEVVVAVVPSSAVDAVPSSFAAKNANDNDGVTTSVKRSGVNLKSSFRSRPGLIRRRQESRGEAPTASVTGATRHSSRSLNMTKTGKKKRPSPSSTSPSSSSSSQPRSTNKAVLHTKIAFVTFLLLTAITSCFLLFSWLRTTETHFAKTQFQSIAKRAVQDSADVVSRKRLSMATMATMISEQFRGEGDWPNVAVVGYDRIVDMLAKTGSHTNMGFAPIVKASEQTSFEQFAYSYFDSRPDFPNNTAINSPDWRGVWRMTPEKKRMHDSDETTLEREILTPIIQCCIDNPGDPILLFNLHSEPMRRKTIDGIIGCSDRIRSEWLLALEEERELRKNHNHNDNNLQESSTRSAIFSPKDLLVGQQQQDNQDATEEGVATTTPRYYPDYSCGSMTEFVKIFRFKTRGPASIMFQPVYPAETPWEIRGLVLSPMAWDEVFEAVFSSNTNGVHAVLESETKSWTYTIEGGRVESFQTGDIHQTKYDEYGVSANLTWDDLHEMGAPMYKLSLYPTDDFVKSYSTSNPTNATFAALSIIVFISILFLIYDYFVRREFLERHQLLEAKRRFIRFVSHEVRTPLNAVLMGLNIIEAEMEPNTESLELLREIQNSTESAVDVLNDVLLYDKIESTLKLDISMVPIWQVVDRTLLEFKLPAWRRQVTLRATYETSTTGGECSYDMGLRVTNIDNLPEDIRGLRVAGDASRIAQVLRNLLSNALKFTSEQGLILVTASYHIKSMVEERTVKWGGSSSSSAWVEKITLQNGEEVMATSRGHFQLSVQDTGVGMSEEQMGKLFGEGVQFNAHELQAGKGSGLGLFIARGLVEQHKGTLDATSEGLDKGSKFTLKLPLYHVPGLVVEKEEEEEEDRSASEKESVKNEELSQGEDEEGLRLLVVDDAPSNRTLLSRLLERRGHKCDMAENGQVALEMVRDTMLGLEEPYDCILMDCEMPVMNGPTASSLIRELGSDVFIIGITGNVLSDDVNYFKSRGANAILPKPVQLSLLEDLFMEYHLTY